MPDTPERDTSPPETILAFDFGMRRIGVAVGQTITGSASPLGVITNGDDGPDFDAISGLVKEWQPSRLIVGLPLHADGSPGDMQPHVENFLRELLRYQLQIDTVDERYTSLEAQTALKNARAAGSRGRISREMIDSAAAVIIAERFLTRRTNV
ncbi:MAG: Holliday junction resolvase RuvX [Gammaproteobacteria bacterium]|nr:Holliday junction resolvase RuvX [Gammaproteobacteria bacterium]MDH3373436.1 Holliday junction resolvase RuvX [Gammaproteobacteria bacterium]MDH3410558.1 Holliday junction resolvase RuvX [Gammaproteobacteria bacterium]